MIFKISDLEESNEFLNILLNNVTAAIVVIDKNLHIRIANDSFYNIFDIESKEYIHEPSAEIEVTDIATPCIRSCIKCLLVDEVQSIFNNRQSRCYKVVSRNCKLRNKVYKKFYKIKSKLIHFDHQEMVMLFIDDVSLIEAQRQELESQNTELSRLNKLKNQYLGMASHDLRSPINIIQMYAETIMDLVSPKLSEEEISFIQAIYDQSIFMAQLINDLLDISHIESGTMNLNYTSQNIYSLLVEHINLNSLYAKRKQIEIHLNSKATIQPFYFDKPKIGQVLDNLISNAIKYSENKKKINIAIFQENNFVVIKLKDSGVGIPEKDLDKLFHPFKKTSAKSPSGEKSTGLGLAIVKKIVEGHGGWVKAESKVGKGSCFSFAIPVNVLPEAL